jgi:hypothetical protein
MKILRFFLFTFLTLSSLCVVLYFFCARQVGRLEAEYDYRRGHYEIHGYGRVNGDSPEVEGLRQYGIRYRQVAGCVVDDFIVMRVAGYNTTMIKAIKQDLNIAIDWQVTPCVAETGAQDTSGEGDIDDSKMGSDGSHPSIYKDDEGFVHHMGDCFSDLFVELDGDSTQEEVCLRYLQSKSDDKSYTYTSIVVDISKGKKQIPRQVISREFYFEEHFVAFKDIDADGRAELITRVRFSPNCSGCSAYRVYEFKDNLFELKLNLFEIELEHPSLSNILCNIGEINKEIIFFLKKKTKIKYMCDGYEGCSISSPWLVDTNRDGQLEIVILIQPPRDVFASKTPLSHVFFAKYSATGKILQHTLIPLPPESGPLIDVLGFLKTRDNRTHLLMNIGDIGTTPAFPILNILDIHWPKMRKIGEFCGFYTHVLADRLRDLDGNGNTEIIYVGETYWPPNGSHADIVLSYDIAEYRKGKYIENNAKFESTREIINQKFNSPVLDIP